jgi:hypothetical protein
MLPYWTLAPVVTALQTKRGMALVGAAPDVVMWSMRIPAPRRRVAIGGSQPFKLRVERLPRC